MSLQKRGSDECPEVVAEQELGEAGERQALSNYSQKLVEQKERELKEIIYKNYCRIKGVEKELSSLQLQLKLTAGPKKHALELLRKKIEIQNEKVVAVRQRHSAAKQVLEAVEVELKREEAVKDQLCSELNLLVQQSATAQLNKLDDLKRQLELLQGFPSDVSAELQNPFIDPASTSAISPAPVPPVTGSHIPAATAVNSSVPSNVEASHKSSSEGQSKGARVDKEKSAAANLTSTSTRVNNASKERASPLAEPGGSSNRHGVAPNAAVRPQSKQGLQPGPKDTVFRGFDT